MVVARSRKVRWGMWGPAFAAVIVWRGVAWGLSQDSQALYLGVLGLTFLACGLWVLWDSRVNCKGLFVGYALCTGLHWGGPITVEPIWAKTVVDMAYLNLSGVLATSLLVHFVLAYPPRSNGLKNTLVWFVYAPVVLATLLTLLGMLSMGDRADENLFVNLFKIVYMIASYGYGLWALVAITLKARRQDPDTRQRFHLHWAAWGMWLGVVPWLVTSILGWEVLSERLLYALVLIPISIALALVRAEPRAKRPKSL